MAPRSNKAQAASHQQQPRRRGFDFARMLQARLPPPQNPGAAVSLRPTPHSAGLGRRWSVRSVFWLRYL